MAKMFADRSKESLCERYNSQIKVGVAAAFIFAFLLTFSSLKSGRPPTTQLNVATWNVAAINNNPFEYWITHSDKEYNALMDAVQEFIENPGDRDVLVSSLFTDAMFAELEAAMKNAGFNGVGGAAAIFKNDYRNRKIVSGFMKDAELGLKRLASMPDRTTNTISTEEGPVYRPTVINCYNAKLDEANTLTDWWRKWLSFMFKTTVKKNKGGKVQDVHVYKLLVPIKRSKYPALTAHEERISIPLQTVCGAIFDAILVHIVSTLSPHKWQDLRMEMCEALNLKKTQHTLDILTDSYSDRSVIFMQEVSSSVISAAEHHSGLAQFTVSAPEKLSSRNQNSVMLLNKASFDVTTAQEITEKVEGHLPEKAPVATGDIFAITINSIDGQTYMLASFHGDTNGLASIAVVTAVHEAYQALNDDSIKLIFGLDANTYEHAKPGKTQDVLEFAEHYVSKSMTSCWGDHPNPKEHTTRNARTFLQPQLNKAAKRSELETKGDVNPKDFILFYNKDFSTISVAKDNTGKKDYKEDMVFPTLQFPSDHGILFATLQPVQTKNLHI